MGGYRDAEFLRLLEPAGNSVSGLDLVSTFPGMGHGVSSTRALRPGERVAVVVTSLSLLPGGPRRPALSSLSDVFSFLASLPSRPPPALRAALALMHLFATCELEQSGGRLSSKAAQTSTSAEAKFLLSYLRRMPRAFQTPAFWRPADLELLRGTALEDPRALGLGTRAVYDAEVAPVVRQRPRLWPEKDATFDDWRRAAAVVESRAVWPEEGAEGPCLVPVLDSFNHSDDPDVRYVRGAKGAFVLEAARKAEAGRQLFVCYKRAMGPAESLARYGFCEYSQQAPRNVTVLFPDALLGDLGDRLRAVRDAMGAGDFAFSSESTEVPQWLAALHSARQGGEWDKSLAVVPRDRDAYESFAAFAREVVEKKLGAYHGGRTDAASDLRTAQDAAARHQERDAAYVRYAEKRALQKLLDVVESARPTSQEPPAKKRRH
eukprot:m51a1_g7007 hypothetical protein (434) ;mRNA; f:233409-234787